VSVQYLLRADVDLPLTVHNFDGVSKRPVLPLRLPYILCHYTGVPVSTRRYAHLGMDALPELIKVVHSINRWRRNEYNYIIAQDGTVVEFAGRFQAAHCGRWPLIGGRTWNDKSYGVLFLNAVEEPPTWPQIEGFVWLKNVLRWVQAVEQDVTVLPHSKAKPTGCPGLFHDAIEGLQAA
jgi:hypothetical protein